MHYAELPAPTPLDELVHCFWFQRDAFPASEPQTVVADGRVEIILLVAEPSGAHSDCSTEHRAEPWPRSRHNPDSRTSRT